MLADSTRALARCDRARGLPRPAAALMVLAAMAVVAWIRLLPLALPGLQGYAEDLVRSRIAGAGARDGAGVDSWIAAHPAAFARKVAATRARLAAQLRYRAGDGREHVYLGDLDSYLWLRRARQYLRAGTTCEQTGEDGCRDLLTMAPVGASMRYARSIHIAAIVAVHRLATLLRPGWPLPSSAYLVPVIVGTLGVLPGFGLGRRLAGDVAGVTTAVVMGLNPAFLLRSMGGDDDVWNVVLPATVVWAIVAALGARRARTAVACAGVAAAVEVVHAASWQGWVFTWAVVVTGLTAQLAVSAARSIVPAHRTAAVAALRRTAAVLLVFCAAGATLAGLAGEAATYLHAPHAVLDAVRAPQAAPASAQLWPDVFSTVAELRHSGRAGIEEALGGRLSCFAGWLGLLVLLLPRRGWRPAHFLVLIGGTLLYRLLLAGPELPGALLLGLLALPLVAAVLVSLLDEHEDTMRGANLLVVVWCLASLYLAHGAARFTLLLAAPFAVTFGVAAAALVDLLRDVAARYGTRSAVVAPAAGWLAVAALLVPPVLGAEALASAYLPKIHDAWWDTLVRLRHETPADAIVVTWWDYGYWTEYAAERRTTADGGALLSHAPHWIARALLAADENESLGLLRMLACGSDATPAPEGAQGAWGALVAHGIDGAAARDLVVELARLDEPHARARLTARGLDTAATDAVLRATHCAPPPTYLVLSSAQSPLWTSLGRATPDEATSAPEFLLTPRAVPCRPTGAAERRCAGPGLAGGRLIEGFVYPPADPAAGRLVLPSERAGREVRPDTLLLASDGRLDEITERPAAANAIGVLLDVDRAQAAIGSPALLRSTYARLMFLGGRYAPHFEPVDDRVGWAGERVATWRVRWPAAD